MIDAHAHIAADDETFRALLAELDVRVLNICVAHNQWKTRARPTFRDLARSFPNQFSWCTTFDLPRFESSGAVEADYADAVIAEIRQDLRDGAVAVKVWKNIGMELARPDGTYVLIDDPVFEPIFSFCEAQEVPVLMHIGEPRACWRPLSEPSPHSSYYREHPEWHMYGRDDMPSHQALIDARDRVVQRHPSLSVIGAHLGSLEYDVQEVARRLDRYPNFAVDISARLGDLLTQDPRQVRTFFEEYSDRILFGTDIVTPNPLSALITSADGVARRERILQSIRRTYAVYRQYLETEEQVEHGGQESRGIGLSPGVLQSVCRDNARRWYGLR